jgi:polysaccharide export outer membrane protein
MKEILRASRVRKYAAITVYGLVVTMMISCAQTRPQVTHLPAADMSSASDDNYLIGSEDTVEVLVWKNADLSRVVNVRPDGKISLPLIGDVQAAGMTVMQLNAEITEKLKKYYKEPPQVSVILQQVNSYSIYVLGEVRSPGKYIVKSGTTFLQAITLAGGFTEFASRNKVTVRRRSNDNSEKVIPIKYHDILSGLQSNVMMFPGDTILIP